MIAFRAVRGVATNEQKWRPFTNLPWMLVRVICLLFLARGWSVPCRAEERPVIENSIGMKLVSIPAGEFLMGMSDQDVAKVRARMEKARVQSPWFKPYLELLETAKPQHRVVITKPFFLGRYKVTQKEFSAVMGFNRSAYQAGRKRSIRTAGYDPLSGRKGVVAGCGGVLPAVVGPARGSGCRTDLSPADRG